MAGALIVHDRTTGLPPDVVLLMTQVLMRRLHFCRGDWRFAVETHNTRRRDPPAAGTPRAVARRSTSSQERRAASCQPASARSYPWYEERR